MKESFLDSQEKRDDYIELSVLEGIGVLEEDAETTGENENFDPYDYGKQTNGISFWPAVIHTFIAAASPTLMNMPFTFSRIGYVIGFAGSFAVVLFYANCMHTLLSVEYVVCKRLRKTNLTYADLIHYAFAVGPRKLRWFANSARLLVYVDFLCIWGGGNAINALLVSENVKCIYDYLYDADVNVRLVMVCLSFPLIALCWIPNLKLLAICSTVANVVNISCIVIILYASFSDLPPSILADRKAFGDMSRVPIFLAVILITVNSTGIIMPLKNEMKKPGSLSSRFGVLNAAYFPVSFLYAFFGSVCYVKYGDNVKENIVLNMPDTIFGKTVQGLYTMGIVFTYPLMSYVAFDIVWNNILKDKVRKNSAYATKKYCCRTLVAALSIAVAFIVPDITLFVSLTGNVGVSLDSIIFPALAELLVCGAEGCENEKIGRRGIALFCKNITYIIFGIILCISGFLESLAAL